MRFFFIVQGEGRGHMTQAISLSTCLRAQGHEVCRVVVGRSERREIPKFFNDDIGAPISQIDSPNFVTDTEEKGVDLWKSIVLAVRRIGTYRNSIRFLDKLVKEESPDVIVNFFDFIGGLYVTIRRPSAKVICVSHQYLAGHSTFEFPAGNWMDRWAMHLGNWITALGASKRVALSFSELPDEPGIEVVPPLLRPEVRELKVSNEGHLLVYMLNYGYSDEIDAFHQKNPNYALHCFWDKKDEPDTKVIDGQLSYHKLNSELFLKHMASCEGFLTTAGFESVCEAMYLGKPVLMMPVEGHYEQACNALDACRAGAGIRSAKFDLQMLLEYIPKHKTDPQIFKQWADRAEAIILQKLTN